MTSSHPSDPERGAKDLLAELKISGIPVPVERIPRLLNAQLRYSPLDKELSGTIYISEGIPIIGVNSLHHPNRQRFTIAHEIGHLRLHKKNLMGHVHVDKGFETPILYRKSLDSASGTDSIEIQANRFAAALLIPETALAELLSKERPDIDDPKWLDAPAKRFKVSKQVLEYRIRNL